MSENKETKISTLTFVFTGPKAEKASKVLWIQYLDGGLDQHIEGLLDQEGVPDTGYTWDTDSRTVWITTDES